MGLNLTLTYLNYRGLHVVGNAAIVMTGLTLAPFVIITLLGGRCVFGTGGMMGGRASGGHLGGMHGELWCSTLRLGVGRVSRCLSNGLQHASDTVSQGACDNVIGPVCTFYLGMLLSWYRCPDLDYPPCPLATGLPHLKPANLVKSDWSAVQWFPFFNVMFW